MMKKIIIAAHKPYAFAHDDLYLPLQVGAAGKKDILDLSTIYLKDGRAFGETIMRDDIDDNISEKNPTYCELTGLYWAWKNLKDADVVGLVHYRRYFTVKSATFQHGHDPYRCVLQEGELDNLLLQYDLLVPRKRIYGIETLYSHYAHTLDAYQLDAAKEIVEQSYPAYRGVIDRIYGRRWGYMFNMAIWQRSDLEDYCQWLFEILGVLEKRLTEEGYLDGLSDFEKRLFGRVSEILFNVWVERKRLDGCRIGEVPVLYIESENWPKKVKSFLAAKFARKKYGESF